MGHRMQVQTITTAQRSATDDIAFRQRRYTITMLARVVCFVLAFTLPVSGPIRFGLVIAAVVLPWIAVMVANGGQPPMERPETLQDRPQRLQLEGSTPSSSVYDPPAPGRSA